MQRDRLHQRELLAALFTAVLVGWHESKLLGSDRERGYAPIPERSPGRRRINGSPALGACRVIGGHGARSFHFPPGFRFTDFGGFGQPFGGRFFPSALCMTAFQSTSRTGL